MWKFRYIIALLIITALFISGEWFTTSKLRLSASLSEAVSFFTPSNDLKRRIFDLELENTDLKSKIFLTSITPPDTYKIYSTYPFNNANEIAISLGSLNNKLAGDTVVAGENLLVGKIKNTYKNYSIVTTIHDPNWETAVRIGESEVNGLFKGGNILTIQLIPGNSTILEGDEVISAGVGMPYGLLIGHIKTISIDITGHFKNAVVVPAVVLNDLRDVSIRHK